MVGKRKERLRVEVIIRTVREWLVYSDYVMRGGVTKSIYSHLHPTSCMPVAIGELRV